MVLIGALCTFPQGPACFSYIFFITWNFPTMVAVNDSTLLVIEVLILGFDQQLFQYPIPFEMCLDTIFSTNLLDALS